MSPRKRPGTGHGTPDPNEPLAPTESRIPDPGSRPFKSGFVAIAGRPNVGKSTLLNRLVGEKIAITAPIPQTTRTRAVGVLHLPHAQIAFVDTPGIHEPRHRLGEHMVRSSLRALREVDAVLLVFDASDGITPADRTVAAAVWRARRPAVLALNKIERARNANALAEEASGLGPFAAIVPLSALQGTNIERLVEALVALLPEGPRYFPEEMITDQPEQYLAREIIREQAIGLLRDELPHALAVEIEEFAPREGRGLTYVSATVLVERPSQKKIVVGSGGSVVREIGRLARAELERLLGTRVYLDLWVKVRPAWREKEGVIRALYPE